MKRAILIIVMGLVACMAWLVYLYFGAENIELPTTMGQASVSQNDKRENGVADFHPVFTKVLTEAHSQISPSTGGIATTRKKEIHKSEKKQKLADVIAGEFVLGFFDDKDRDAFLRLAQAKGLKILDTMDMGHSVRLSVDDKQQLDDLLGESPTPTGTWPNYYVRTPEVMGKDPMAPEYNYLGFGDQSLKWLGISGDATSLGKGIKVAVLDSGVEMNPAIPDGSVTRVNLMGDGSGAAAPGGHGTAVASLIVGDNDGIHGIAQASTIMSVQVLSQSGEGDAFTLAKGIVEAVDNGAQVINMSLGSHGDSDILKQAVDYALSKDVAIVAAVGNDSTEGVLYPAAYDGVVAVSAVDANGRHLYFANRGPEVELSAPGIGVDAAYTNGIVSMMSGTSIATPFVTGAIADLMAASPGMSAQDAVAILCKYADDAGLPGRDDQFGYGILDVERALDRNIAGIYDAAIGDICWTGTSDSPAVTVSVQNRGTEDLAAVNLDVVVDGVPGDMLFYNLAVGQTVSRVVPLSRERLISAGAITVSCSVTTPGVDDANASNNSRSMDVRAIKQ
jgi:thermitase